MAESLIEFLKGREPLGFEPRPVYSQDGDFISLFLKDEDYYAERVDDLLTVYHSVQHDSLIGCKIKGVQRLLSTLGEFGVSVEDDEIELSFLFVAGALISPGNQATYRSLSKRASRTRIARRDLQPA